MTLVYFRLKDLNLACTVYGDLNKPIEVVCLTNGGLGDLMF